MDFHKPPGSTHLVMPIAIIGPVFLEHTFLNGNPKDHISCVVLLRLRLFLFLSAFRCFFSAHPTREEHTSTRIP